MPGIMFKKVVILIHLELFFALIIVSCDLPADMNPPGDSMAGYIMFHSDTGFIYNSGYYAVSLYGDSTFPFNRLPVRSDSLKNIKWDGTGYSCTFHLSGIPTGKYYAASTWIKYPQTPADTPIVLGTYGCDTLYNCTNNKKISFPNFTGNWINIWSWADTSKRLY
jgi:hypothetical protein